jgi:hypothetical protein
LRREVPRRFSNNQVSVRSDLHDLRADIRVGHDVSPRQDRSVEPMVSSETPDGGMRKFRAVNPWTLPYQQI